MENKKRNNKNLFVILFVIFLAGVAFIVYSFTPTNFKYAELQPNFLISLTENNTNNSLGLILEADTLVQCINNYDLRAKLADVKDSTAIIEIEGLYKKEESPWKINSCRPSGAKRPLVDLVIEQSDLSLLEGISFTFQGNSDEYSIVRSDGGSITLEPKKGNFTEVRAN